MTDLLWGSPLIPFTKASDAENITNSWRFFAGFADISNHVDDLGPIEHFDPHHHHPTKILT